MKILKGELILDDVDIDRLVIHRLKDVEMAFENHYDEIVDGDFDMTPLKIFSPVKQDEAINSSQQNIDTPTLELKCVELYIKEYFDDLKYDRTTRKTVVKQIGRIEKGEIPIIKDYNSPSEWVKHTKTALRGIDKYIDGKVEAYQNEEDFTGGINPKVKRCLRLIEEDRNKKVHTYRSTQTPWDKAFEDFKRNKQNNRGVVNTTIEGNRSCLDTIFKILQKKYVEDIGRKECIFINDYIYNLPKHWNQKYKEDQLKELVKHSNKDKISLTSAKKYLRTFREFMKFCKKRDYADESFVEDIEIPQRKEAIIVDGFTKDELKLIFNPSTYPRKNNIYYGYRYWIPLISLYSGMRLNEICQLYVDDVKYIDKTWCFDLTDEREDQHLKNRISKRKVPIHPKLIELGLIKFVKEVKKSRKERLFYQLTFSNKTRYTHMMGAWFGRYLTSIHIEGRNKVFHSFRHTVKPFLRDCGIPQEYQNAICGWASNDIGERVYGGEIPIKKLYDEIIKLDYPFLNRSLKELRKLNEKGK